jgi:hypothetical protein
VISSPLFFPWISSILWLIVWVLLVSGTHLSTFLLIHPIIRLWNYMALFIIFVKVMTLLLFICKIQEFIWWISCNRLATLPCRFQVVCFSRSSWWISWFGNQYVH